MRALVYDQSLSFQPRWADPSPPEGDTLIRVLQAGICDTDLQITRGYMGYTGVLGHEFVGQVVESADKNLLNKRVVGEINIACGRCDLCLSGLANHCRNRSVLGIQGHPGCFADWVRLPATNLHLLPDTVDDDHAVFVEPLAAAYQVLKQVPFDNRKWVTVLGAGRLGLLVAQVLRNAGCPVRVVGRHMTKLALCEKWQIRSRLLSDIAPRHDQDVVVDCTGNPDGFAVAMQMVRPRGTIVLKSSTAGAHPMNLSPLVVDEITVVGSRCGPFRQAIAALEQRQVDVASLVHRRVRFDQAIEAIDLAARPGVLKVLMVMQ